MFLAAKTLKASIIWFKNYKTFFYGNGPFCFI